jgi:hypothetical protein
MFCLEINRVTFDVSVDSHAQGARPMAAFSAAELQMAAGKRELRCHFEGVLTIIEENTP